MTWNRPLAAIVLGASALLAGNAFAQTSTDRNGNMGGTDRVPGATTGSTDGNQGMMGDDTRNQSPRSTYPRRRTNPPDPSVGGPANAPSSPSGSDGMGSSSDGMGSPSGTGSTGSAGTGSGSSGTGSGAGR